MSAPDAAAALSALAAAERLLLEARAAARRAAERGEFIDALLSEHEADLAAARAEVERLTRELRAGEREIKEMSAGLERLRRRAAASGGERERAALQREIAAAAARLDRAEENGLDLIGRLEAAARTAAREEAELAAQRDRAGAERPGLAEAARAAAVRAREAAAEVEARQAELPPALLHAVTQLRARLELPVVALVGASCGGCRAQLPQQEAINLGRGGSYARCEACGRFLVPEP